MSRVSLEHIVSPGPHPSSRDAVAPPGVAPWRQPDWQPGSEDIVLQGHYTCSHQSRERVEVQRRLNGFERRDDSSRSPSQPGLGTRIVDGSSQFSYGYSTPFMPLDTSYERPAGNPDSDPAIPIRDGRAEFRQSPPRPPFYQTQSPYPYLVTGPAQDDSGSPPSERTTSPGLCQSGFPVLSLFGGRPLGSTTTLPLYSPLRETIAAPQPKRPIRPGSFTMSPAPYQPPLVDEHNVPPTPAMKCRDLSDPSSLQSLPLNVYHIDKPHGPSDVIGRVSRATPNPQTLSANYKSTRFRVLASADALGALDAVERLSRSSSSLTYLTDRHPERPGFSPTLCDILCETSADIHPMYQKTSRQDVSPVGPQTDHPSAPHIANYAAANLPGQRDKFDILSSSGSVEKATIVPRSDISERVPLRSIQNFQILNSVAGDALYDDTRNNAVGAEKAGANEGSMGRVREALEIGLTDRPTTHPLWPPVGSGSGDFPLLFRQNVSPPPRHFDTKTGHAYINCRGAGKRPAVMMSRSRNVSNGPAETATTTSYLHTPSVERPAYTTDQTSLGSEPRELQEVKDEVALLLNDLDHPFEDVSGAVQLCMNELRDIAESLIPQGILRDLEGLRGLYQSLAHTVARTARAKNKAEAAGLAVCREDPSIESWWRSKYQSLVMSFLSNVAKLKRTVDSIRSRPPRLDKIGTILDVLTAYEEKFERLADKFDASIEKMKVRRLHAELSAAQRQALDKYNDERARRQAFKVSYESGRQARQKLRDQIRHARVRE